MSTEQIMLLLIAAMGCVIVYMWLTQRKSHDMKVEQPEADPHACPENSLRDPVTDMYSKQHLLQRLEEYMARCDRDNRTLAVVLWDIDGFVKFNNEFGQKEGDRMLKKVSNVIRKSVRVYDEVFRSGPDEFCAILVPADEEIAQEVTARVGQVVSKDLFEGNAEYANKQFSVSSAFVFYPSDSRTADALLHAANQALYKVRKVYAQ